MTYNDQENATGCERIGTLTDFAPTGRLSLDYLKGTYEAVARAGTEGSRTPSTASATTSRGRCSPSSSTRASGSAPQPFPFGADVLSGTRGGPQDQENYTWSFR